LQKEFEEAELCRKCLTKEEQTHWKILKNLLNKSSLPFRKPSFDASREEIDFYKEYTKLS